MKPVIIIILLNISDQETLKGHQGKYMFFQNDSSQNIIEHNILKANINTVNLEFYNQQMVNIWVNLQNFLFTYLIVLEIIDFRKQKKPQTTYCDIHIICRNKMYHNTHIKVNKSR